MLEGEDLPWVMFGDLNEVVGSSEKLGGKILKGKRLFLKDFFTQC